MRTTGRFLTAVLALMLVLVAATCANIARAADGATDGTPWTDTLSALSERFGSQVVAWVGSDRGVPDSARESEDLRGAVAEIMRASPGGWQLRDDVLVLSLPPTWHPVKGIHLPSDLSAMRATLEWIPSDILSRLARGETVDSAVLPEESRDALRVLVETQYWNDELGPHYLRAIEAGRLGLRFEPFATILAVTADLMPGEWIAFLRTQGKEPRREVDWFRWTGWAAVTKPVQPAATLSARPVSIEPGLYALKELMTVISKATNSNIKASGDCADRQVYVAVERMSAARLVRLVADACCLTVWQDGETVFVGNVVPYDDIRCLNKRNLSVLVDLLGPLTAVPSDSQAARVADQLKASPSSRLADIPEDLQSFVRERCAEPLGPDAEVRLIPGFSLCLYPPDGGRHRLIFY
ncbi:MAG: hypothetical protein J7M38_07460 [Armatimonadetes bacterium]|nr:hypothetical protein [Armatimonadota bacterium]